MSVDFIVGIMAETIRITLMISALYSSWTCSGCCHKSLFQSGHASTGDDPCLCSKIVICLITLVAALPWMIKYASSPFNAIT